MRKSPLPDRVPTVRHQYCLDTQRSSDSPETPQECFHTRRPFGNSENGQRQGAMADAG